MEPFPHPPPAMRAALDALVRADPRLRAIEAGAGPLPWRTRAAGFPGLLQIVVGQLISNAAATAIWRRVCAVPGALDPAGLLALPDEALLPTGLSRPKLAHARSLAAAFRDGALSADGIAALDDAGAVAAMTAVRGLGPWTAEIYLLLCLGRPDVFPAGDIAVANGMAHLLGLPARPKPGALRLLAEPWRPYRSLAARLFWHHILHVSGRSTVEGMEP